MLLWFHLVIPSFPARIDDMRSRFSALSPVIQNGFSQSTSFSVPLDEGNEGSGDEIEDDSLFYYPWDDEILRSRSSFTLSSSSRGRVA